MQPIWFALHESFLDLPPVNCFRGCFLPLYERLALPRETHIERGEFVTTDAFQRLPDLALVAEITRLLEDLERWEQDATEHRENWLYLNGLLELPDDCDLYEIFGERCSRLEQLRQRARMITRSLGQPKQEVDLTSASYKQWQAGSTWRQLAADYHRSETGSDFDLLDKLEQKKAEDRIRSRVTEYAERNNLPLRKGKRGRRVKTREK